MLDEAVASFVEATKLQPKFAKAHKNLGLLFQESGLMAEAKKSYSKSIEFCSNFAEAHRLLTLIKTYQTKDAQFHQMLSLYTKGKLHKESLCQINFALAKAFDDLGEFDYAYKHYKEGNALRKKSLRYEIAKDIEIFENLKSTYEKIARTPVPSNKHSAAIIPIFILGMPRSGTTLVEQIISSHTLVSGAGEMDFASNLGEELANGSTPADTSSLQGFRKNYLAKIRKVSKGSPNVTDKMPLNFRLLGLIATALPEAKIVHVKRDRAAVCWSNYVQYFISKNLNYSYSLYDIAKYYSLYESIMEYWHRTLGNKIYNLDYDSLVENQEYESRQVINYLNLDWENGILSPHRNSRAVKTASNVQIRRRIYQGSSKKWTNYESFINKDSENLVISELFKSPKD